MGYHGLGQYAREFRGLAPFAFLAGSILCVAAWAFAFSPAGLPLLIIGSATIIAAAILRRTVRLALACLIALFLAWGGPIWVAGAVSAL